MTLGWEGKNLNIISTNIVTGIPTYIWKVFNYFSNRADICIYIYIVYFGGVLESYTGTYMKFSLIILWL